MCFPAPVHIYYGEYEITRARAQFKIQNIRSCQIELGYRLVIEATAPWGQNCTVH